MEEDDEAELSEGSSETEVSDSGESDEEDDDEEELLEPKVLPRRLTRGGKMNQVSLGSSTHSAWYINSGISASELPRNHCAPAPQTS